jgi:hypothetical protein
MITKKRFFTKNGLITDNILLRSPDKTRNNEIEFNNSGQLIYSGDNGQIFQFNDVATGSIFKIGSSTEFLDIVKGGNITLTPDELVEVSKSLRIKSTLSIGAGSSSVNIFAVADSDNTEIMNIKQNGDVNISTISINSTETKITGDVNLADKITVDSDASATVDVAGSLVDITGNLDVSGDTNLGDASTDTTTITGIGKVNGSLTTKSDVTKAGGNAGTTFFAVTDSANSPMVQVRENGDVIVNNDFIVRADGKVEINGDVDIGNIFGVDGSSTVVVDITGDTFTVDGNFSVTGNVVLGDAATDDITINGSIDSNIIPKTDDTYDIGSTTKKWANVYAVDGFFTEITTTGDVVVGGDLTVNGTTTVVNSTEVNIGDNIIRLNANHTGTPTMNAGFEVERGDEADVKFTWNEASDTFTTNGQPLTAPTFNGDLNGNASTATALETARTIAITGQATGSASFDGTQNIEIDVTLSGSAALTDLESDTVTLKGSVELTASDQTTTALTPEVIATFAVADYAGGKFVIHARDTVTGHTYITELLLTHNGTIVAATEYGAVATLDELASYDGDISGGNVRLIATPVSSNSTVFTVYSTLMKIQ